MADFDFQINLAHNQLSIEGRQLFELDLVYHLLDKDFSINLLFADTNITPFFLIMGKKDFGGKLSGKMVAKGNKASLEKSEALLDISNVSLTYQGVSFLNANNVQGNLKQQNLSIPEFHLIFLEAGHLRVKGSGTLDGYFDLTADGDVPAEAAMLFLKDVTDIKGKISLQAEMKGSVSEPGLSAEIVFHDIGYTLPQINAPFKGINGKMQLSSSHLRIENITGNLDSGMFQVNGDVALENFRPGNIQLDCNINKMPINVPETMDVLLSANLSASGTMEDILLEGDIVILEGVYYKNAKTSLLESMQEKTRSMEVPVIKKKTFLFDNVRYNISLTYREPFIVDNDIAYLEIHPDLNLSGTLNTPVITGTAKVQAGTITFQNKSFIVERGIVSFLDPYKIAPELDITGSIKIRKWLISLTVQGAPDRLIVELASTPSEEDADILSLLVFGKTTYEMSSGNTDDTDSTETLMAKLIASSFGANIKKTTGLDYLEVKTDNDETESASDSVNVTVGKDLSERLAIKYTIGSGRGGYHQRAATEYKLIEYILLSGFQDIEGSYGGEIIFRIEFRIF
jgi:autotransporter translocation and assembly factor TamB